MLARPGKEMTAKRRLSGVKSKLAHGEIRRVRDSSPSSVVQKDLGPRWRWPATVVSDATCVFLHGRQSSGHRAKTPG